MKINHLIIGSEDMKKSMTFYTEILGFNHESTFIDTGSKREGQVLVKNSPEGELELLLVPLNDDRLPSPQHLAFEVNDSDFKSIFDTATAKSMDIRAMPPLDCKIKGIGTTEVRGRKFERFYLIDPSRVNIEFMRLC